jgi:hypothetical protein
VVSGQLFAIIFSDPFGESQNNGQLTTDNGQNKKSRAKQRGTSKNRLEVGGASIEVPCCLAVYFMWPQVALTHHVFFQTRLYAPAAATVKRRARRAGLSI